MQISTNDSKSVIPFLRKLKLPVPNSHKGQNGKVMIIGGSTLFHAASLWAAEIASHFADMVHYASTPENNEIMLQLKTLFRNGIVISRADIQSYVQEDDVVLIGPGLVRGDSATPPSSAGRQHLSHSAIQHESFEKILLMSEGVFSREITTYLFQHFPEKRFVIDAGALQMMKPETLTNLKKTPIITPHQGEFEKLFGVSLQDCTQHEKVNMVTSMAKKYECVILLKAIYDIVSDGTMYAVIEGGNAGLTKGGSGDVLAGLTACLYAHADPVSAAIVASFVIKKTAEELARTKGLWYNTSDLIHKVPEIFTALVYNDNV